MKSKPILPSTRNRIRAQINEPARILDNAIKRLRIPASQQVSFVNWLVSSLWEDYKAEKMNQKLIIENEIKNLHIQLPNGTIKKPYHASFPFPSEAHHVEIINGQELGLSLAKTINSCILSGEPTQAGDFILKIRFNTIEGEEPSEISIPIAFNPNPRDLWKNIPTDENISYFKPDFDSGYVKITAGEDELPSKDMVAASQRGRSHAQEGKARDDHFKLFHCPNSNWYIMAVADGAGSAQYSRKGSWVACETVVEHCKSLLLDNKDFEKAIIDYNGDRNDEAKRKALTQYVYDIIFKGAVKAHDEINRVANLEQKKTKDFATTLMFAICKQYEFGWFIASFWVGDGAMCLYDEKGKTAKLLGVPDEGEFSGQTRFITMPEIFHEQDVISKRLKMTIVHDFTALLLMTDGVSDPMFETDKNLNDFSKWEEFYNKLKNGFPEDEIKGVNLVNDNENAKEELLKWLDFWSPGNHDDRTIAILY